MLKKYTHLCVSLITIYLVDNCLSILGTCGRSVLVVEKDVSLKEACDMTFYVNGSCIFRGKIYNERFDSN